MKRTAQYSIRIAEPATKGLASRVRKQFNTLIKKLEAARLRLAAWKEALPAIMGQAEREFKPLALAYLVRQRALVLLLDQMYPHKSMSKKDRAKLTGLICSMAFEVLEGDDDAELKDIYNRHSGGDFDAEAAEEGALLKDMMEHMMGARLDTGPEQQAAPAKAAARERRQAAEAKGLKQSVRDIFRKLTSELHPDREADPAERERKTALMQRVNVAYAANDLLGLLELQLEVEQLDQAGLNNLSEERIRQYNKIIDGQLREIEREIADIEYLAELEMGGKPRGQLTPQAMMGCLLLDIAKMQARLDIIAAELDEFRDADKLKAWLKTYRPASFDDAYRY